MQKAGGVEHQPDLARRRGAGRCCLEAGVVQNVHRLRRGPAKAQDDAEPSRSLQRVNQCAANRRRAPNTTATPPAGKEVSAEGIVVPGIVVCSNGFWPPTPAGGAYQ